MAGRHNRPPRFTYRPHRRRSDLAGSGNDAVLAIAPRNVGGGLVEPGDAVEPTAQHAGVIDSMAAPSAARSGWRDVRPDAPMHGAVN
jgi:hypothetical protein